jgi:hypothetical protein
MKKNEFIILFGLILLGFSVQQISGTIYNISWFSSKEITLEWIYIDTLYIVWLILAPIVILGIGVAVRSIEKKQRYVPNQIAQQVSKIIENFKFCTSCGNQNPRGALFCINCGVKCPVI